MDEDEALLGNEMRCYRKADDEWVEVKNIVDLTRNLPTGEADVSSRATGGWTATREALKDFSADWNMRYIRGDADFVAFRAAHDAKTPIELAFADGPIDEAGTLYLHVPAAGVFNFTIGEPLTEGADIAVTVKNRSTTNPPVWVLVEGSGSGE